MSRHGYMAPQTRVTIRIDSRRWLCPQPESSERSAPEGEPRVSKPANPDVLVAMVAGLLHERLAAEYHGA